MRYSLLASFLLILAACNSNEQASSSIALVTEPSGKSLHSAIFNQSFGELLSNYYRLSDSFITENDSAITRLAQKMLVSADSLKLNELQADSITIALAKTFTMGISSEIRGLLGEASITEKRKEFQLIGDQLYDLMKTVKFDYQKVYHIFCSEAFKDQGAFWLSASSEIRNPYLPKKMISCGEIKDSLDLQNR